MFTAEGNSCGKVPTCAGISGTYKTSPLHTSWLLQNESLSLWQWEVSLYVSLWRIRFLEMSLLKTKYTQGSCLSNRIKYPLLWNQSRTLNKCMKKRKTGAFERRTTDINANMNKFLSNPNAGTFQIPQYNFLRSPEEIPTSKFIISHVISA